MLKECVGYLFHPTSTWFLFHGMKYSPNKTNKQDFNIYLKHPSSNIQNLIPKSVSCMQHRSVAKSQSISSLPTKNSLKAMYRFHVLTISCRVWEGKKRSKRNYYSKHASLTLNSSPTLISNLRTMFSSNSAISNRDRILPPFMSLFLLWTHFPFLSLCQKAYLS